MPGLDVSFPIDDPKCATASGREIAEGLHRSPSPDAAPQPLTRRRFLALTAAGLASVPSAGSTSAASAAGGVAFLVVGDWGEPGRRDDAMTVADRMGEIADVTRARFVISTGDNFYPSGVTGVNDPKWSSVFEEVYRAKSLSCPWYPVLGNHDYDGNEQAEVEYSSRSRRWRMERRYYARSEPLDGGGRADFFFIDTEPLDDQSLYSRWVRREDAVRDQLDWLDAGLASSRATWKIVVGHHPVFSGGYHGNTPELREAVQPLLERHGVRAYLNGHDHDLQHIVVNGIHYLTSGAGSMTRPTGRVDGTRFAASSLGFMSARIEGSEMAVSFIGTDGHEMYGTRIPARI